MRNGWWGGMSPEFNVLLFGRSDGYAVRGDVVKAMDIEGCGWVSGNNDVGIFQGPFQPLVEEMPLEPAVTVLWIFEEVKLVNLDGCLACLPVCISSQRIEICHALFHIPMIRIANL